MPPFVPTESGCAPDLSTMLITPAIASEPYWAAAPSRRTSIFSMAEAGIAFRSTPVVPRPMTPLVTMCALWWRRLPLTSTSTWSGPRPRSVAGRTVSAPSEMVGRGKLNAGDSVWRIAFVSLAPAVWICFRVSTSTGTAFSASAPGAREPTVISSWNERPSVKSSAWPEGDTVIVRLTGRRPADVTRNSSGFPAESGGSLNWYRPFDSVITDRPRLSTATVAPGNARPSSLVVTRPVTVISCAWASPAAARQASATRAARIVMEGLLSNSSFEEYASRGASGSTDPPFSLANGCRRASWQSGVLRRASIGLDRDASRPRGRGQRGPERVQREVDLIAGRQRAVGGRLVRAAVLVVDDDAEVADVVIPSVQDG